ncbi:Sorting nexin-13 [Atta colombica]|uniref:Sorting nexin-13 n=1 Tax=Atta colombica TaxID=520822 RepID=A0A195AU43_9HYME|nr:PREDICTED: sorting nexin-13-like [Atta colombica]XP_018058056.1 PREDICTED: sorting nexin-13-like [Atta colombica]KYM75577.1 Sorting nexin-13 [Atta colombica]
MNVPLFGILGAAVTLFAYIFGIGTIIKLLICLLTLILGTLICIYRTYSSNLDNVIKSEREDLTKKTEKFRQYILDLSKERMTFTLDRRITGSCIIDESLQEILDFLIRDYVEPWYSIVTDDEEFIYSVRDTAQKIAINVANRVKSVDWIPYLTTRLVDDAASHVRLYRQASARMKQLRSNRVPKGSASSSTSGGTPKKTPTHRRNKSETDVSWYSQSKFYIPNLSSLTEPIESSGDEKEDESLEKIFFDLEIQMENNLICRDLVCTNDTQELEFLGEISEILLYLVLPKADFDCLTVRFVLRELLVNVIIRPLLDLFSDPDYINQACIWLCTKDGGLPSDIFLTVIRLTDNLDELMATKNIVCKEIAHLRSKDSGGDDDLSVKQQLNSLVYVKKILETRIIGMQEGLETETDGIGAQPEWNRLLIPGQKLVNLPLDELLKNNIALSYFIDYMTSINAEAYLFFYLNIYGWRVSAEQQISDIELQKIQSTQSGTGMIGAKRKNADLDNLKEAATKIYQQYLSDKASPKLQLDDTLVKSLVTKTKVESVKETWFDELRNCCYEKLQNEDRFLPGFKRSMAYIKLLAELDLLKDPVSEDDTKSLDSISLSSTNNELDTLDELSETCKTDDTKPAVVKEGTKKSNSSTSLTSIGEANESKEFDEVDTNTGNLKGVKNTRMGSTAEIGEQIGEKKDISFYMETNAEQFVKLDENNYDQNAIKKLQQGRFEITATIIETGIVSDRGKTYGIYAVAITKNYDSGYKEKWHIYRRYSDFYDLHQKIKEKYYDLAKIPFPAKKAFHNMERTVLERRMLMLNAWLCQLTKPAIMDGHMGLQNLLLAFLEQGDYDKGVTGGQISRTIDTLMNPLKTSMKSVTQAVKTMPDNMLSTVDGVMDNLSKFFGNPKKTSIFYENTKVSAGLDTETDDNIPLRIMLLLMDEIFDLKVRNQWLRRRIITLLRQIIRTMFGDIVNRRILEYVSFMTSPSKVAGYLRLFKNSFWPNGVKAESKPPRDTEMKNRTRVAAKIALLSCLSDELKHIIGSETTRRGLLRVFELFQRPVLNRRLLYVLLEGIVETLFPQNNLVTIFRKLYSVSPRVRSKSKTKS